MRTLLVDSIIFDLDGTLWDASASCTAACNAVLEQAGYQDLVLIRETIRSFSGLKIEDIFRLHFNFIPKEGQADLLDRYKQKEAILMKDRGGILYPGVAVDDGSLRLNAFWELPELIHTHLVKAHQ